MDTAARPRILLVDDEPVVGNLHAALLGGAGYTATLASCAEEALALLARTSFDLLFLDLYFPGTGGWELLGRVRERFGPSKLPVVMISGEANPTVRASLL